MGSHVDVKALLQEVTLAATAHSAQILALLGVDSLMAAEQLDRLVTFVANLAGEGLRKLLF